jgi:hypothetical protein
MCLPSMTAIIIVCLFLRIPAVLITRWNQVDVDPGVAVEPTRYVCMYTYIQYIFISLGMFGW